MHGIDEKKAFFQIINRLCQVFGMPASDSFIDGYWMALEDLSLDVFNAACKRAAAENEFMPKPVEIRRLAGEKSPADKAADAWELFNRFWPREANATLKFEDDLIHSAIRSAGGTRRLSEASSDDWQWVKKDFEAAYLRHLEHQPSGDFRAPLSPPRELINWGDNATIEIPNTGSVKRLTD